MGLTGVITARRAAHDPGRDRLHVGDDHQRLPDLDAVMAAMAATDDGFTYSVAWIDTLARGRALGRSVLSQGEHATRDRAHRPGRARDPLAPPGAPAARGAARAARSAWSPGRPCAPSTRPGSARRRGTGRARSSRCRRSSTRSTASRHWNRLYGPRGFVQYQFVVPDDAADDVARILERISGRGAPVVPLRAQAVRPGQPRARCPSRCAGWTLALDLPAHPGLAAAARRASTSWSWPPAAGSTWPRTPGCDPALLRAMYPRLDEFRGRAPRGSTPTGVFQSDLSRRLDLTL